MFQQLKHPTTNRHELELDHELDENDVAVEIFKGQSYLEADISIEPLLI
jgi:hypothetical protein